ncbi:alpha/beta hydrolase [Streptomyces sp. NBC_00053]|uniref:alpha/beta hydrolase family protein n=1 Tax=unclassified Streptomyces TaxID=2593676 RepID=UPI0022598295|nr:MULTISPECIES: alpha/beta hydrolase [unclassified Streptomyces]MCX5502081.1 alpha/beta hydrolase [Streptomyces sp. NBC_00052]MCX5549383.1 alpha/beta hydrolase [Streptomyces sp. NBC_00051]
MSSVSEGRFRDSAVPLITPGPLRTTLRTDDGVRIEAVYEPCTAGAGAVAESSFDGTAIVLAHGFTGSVDRPAVRRAAGVFAGRAAVVTFSFRGHGGSGGRSTVGDREVLDLAAAVAWARSLGHRRVVTVGFSMGGSVVLRHGALYAGRPVDATGAGDVVELTEREGRVGARAEAHADAVVAVSAPARWYYRGTAPMRRLHWVVTRPLGRLVGRYGLHTRIDRDEWNPVPLAPVEAAGLFGPTPLLIVHGDRDPYFPLDHPRSLADAAGDGAELWLERGMGHAENAADETLLTRIADWAVTP